MKIDLACGSYLVAAIGTEIGKTFFVENYCRQKIASNQKITAIKPVISGFDENDQNNDSARILKALGREISPQNLAEISPWRFFAPIAPCFAANDQKTREINQRFAPYKNAIFDQNGEIDFGKLAEFCQINQQTALAKNQTLLIETAGGIMTPITYQKNFLDLASELEMPIILISANYLGAISHSLTAISAIKSRHLKIAAFLINSHFGKIADPDELKKIYEPHLKGCLKFSFNHSAISFF